MSAVTPAFTLRFNQAILPGQVVVGKFDGERPSLACATAGGRVFIHSPHDATAVGGVRYLNINREITALAVGRLQNDSVRDILLVGTANSIQAYDVQENRDLFYREVPDAVTAIVVGRWNPATAPTVFAGGNCSIQGFDAAGQDVYWTVTGDVVTTLCMTDCDGDARPELLVGSADFDIREYRGDDIACEITETDKVVALCDVVPGRFAYALANGTVGVYNGATATRVWRVKSKSRVSCLASFDMDADGIPEVVAGWASGKIEVRRHTNGELVFRDYMPSAVAAIVVADYRMDGRPVLICAAVDGEVRAFAAAEGDVLAAHRVAAGISSPGDNAGSPSPPKPAVINEVSSTAPPAKAKPAPAPVPDDANVAALLDDKAKLEAELRSAEVAVAAAAEKKSAGGPAIPRGLPPGAISADTDVVLNLEANSQTGVVELVALATTEVSLRALVVFALDAALFGPDRESVVVIPPSVPSSVLGAAPVFQDTRTLRAPLRVPSNTACDVRVQAVVGARTSSSHFVVIEKAYRLPRFAMFQYVPAPQGFVARQPTGVVRFVIRERASRVAMWIAKNFVIRPDQLVVLTSAPAPGALALDARFLDLRRGSLLRITVAQEHGDEMAIFSDSMELCGEIIQDVAAFIGIASLEASADFPEDIAAFQRTLSAMEEYNAIRTKLTGEMAETASAVKSLVIQAEDARLLADMAGMRRFYSELRGINGELLGEYLKRANNHAALVATLKDVNQMIQRASNLRVGEPKSRVVAACRNAIKSNNLSAMITVIATGKATA